MTRRWAGLPRSFTLGLLACGRPPAPVPAAGSVGAVSDVCRASDAASFEGCAGKRSAFDGQVASMVAQHPVTAGPGTAPPSFVDVAGVGQVVVEPRAEVTCGGAVTVEGRLERVDLGGAPGTKESYTGWRVADATVTCR